MKAKHPKKGKKPDRNSPVESGLRLLNAMREAFPNIRTIQKPGPKKTAAKRKPSKSASSSPVKKKLSKNNGSQHLQKGLEKAKKSLNKTDKMMLDTFAEMIKENRERKEKQKKEKEDKEKKDKQKKK